MSAGYRKGWTVNNIGKKGVLVLTTSGLLMAGLGFVGAQNAQTGGAEAQTLSEPQGQQRHAFGPGFGLRGVPFGHLALGTTVEVTFYDGDPGAGGTEGETLTFTYGEDSEAAFAQTFAEARENAAFMVVNIGEQVQTLNLADASDGSLDRGFGHLDILPLRGLSQGSTVEATFYDGDPEANAQTLQTLTFMYGQDSEAGFAADFAEAAGGAAFVRITVSPQTYTVDLSVASFGQHGGPRGSDDFGRHGGPMGGDDFGRGGFGLERFR